MPLTPPMILHFARTLRMVLFFMLIRGLSAIERFLRKNASARTPMVGWVQIVQSADWTDLLDMRTALPTADAIRGTNLTCFNVGGNSYRLIVVVSYERQEI